MAVTEPRISIFFQAAPGREMAYAGKEIGENDVGFVIPGLDLWQRICGESQLAGFSLPEDVVARQSLHAFGRDLTPRSDRFIATLPPAMMARLRRSHAELMKVANTRPEIIADNVHAAKGLDAQMTEAFLECLDSGFAEKVHATKRQQSLTVKRLYELGVERADEPLYVMDACEALGVSARVLHRTCREQLGIVRSDTWFCAASTWSTVLCAPRPQERLSPKLPRGSDSGSWAGLRLSTRASSVNPPRPRFGTERDPVTGAP